MLYELIRRLRPELCLEIGTFFANTTELMAQAQVDSGGPGRVVTLDPFGGDRVPGILDGWPEELRSRVTFKPVSSMDFFLELETTGVAKGHSSPLGVSFIDGHHSFEYALFDVIRTADHTRPGGAIVIDNLEQRGPGDAVTKFLEWNPAWSSFCAGRLQTAASWRDAAGSLVGAGYGEDSWGVLLAPPGLQVAAHGTKITKRGLAYRPVTALRANVTGALQEGRLDVVWTYVAVPPDLHLRGTGTVLKQMAAQCTVRAGAGSALLEFDSPVTLKLERPDMNILYELEMIYRATDPDAYLLLDAEEPIVLVS